MFTTDYNLFLGRIVYKSTFIYPWEHIIRCTASNRTLFLVVTIILSGSVRLRVILVCACASLRFYTELFKLFFPYLRILSPSTLSQIINDMKDHKYCLDNSHFGFKSLEFDSMRVRFYNTESRRHHSRTTCGGIPCIRA